MSQHRVRVPSRGSGCVVVAGMQVNGSEWKEKEWREKTSTNTEPKPWRFEGLLETVDGEGIVFFWFWWICMQFNVFSTLLIKRAVCRFIEPLRCDVQCAIVTTRQVLGTALCVPGV